MATGKHQAIRLGLSIVVLLHCDTGPLLSQTPGHAAFHILENGEAIGTAAISIAHSDEGWRVESTSRAAGAIGLEVRRLDATYDPAWRMRFLSMELARGDERRVIHVAIQPMRSRTDVVIPDKEAGFGTHHTSPGVIAVPDYVFGAYQALAARVESMAPGQDIPLLLTPRGEVQATVDAVREEELRAAGGTIRAKRVSVIVLRDIPTPIEIWAAQGMLLKAELPLDKLVLVRDDVQ